MGAHNRHTDAGGCHLDRLIVPDLAGLLHHLHLLLVVSIVHHGGIVREKVESILEREDLHGDWLVVQNLPGLKDQLVHGSLPGAAGCLVGADDHALHRADLVEGRDSHQCNDGGAVGVGNDTALALAPLETSHCLRIDFGDDQGHPVGHAEGRAVVHNHGAAVHSSGCKFLADASASTEQRNVDTLEAVCSKLLNNIVLPLISEFLSSRPCAGQHLQVAVREVALLQHLEELLPHGAGDSHNRNGWCSCHLSWFCEGLRE
mmetsp:Transcript_5308/g.14792  ORF Transcript_5308/g.14792 Transcript_5308/m.14792 type:complete len:260 (-) Transcript_5308:161-940(-)